MSNVAALFVRSDSVYYSLPGVDCWDIDRDARNWPGGCPVVVHPPCRAWGRLRHLAKPREDEKALAIWAVAAVRRWGGVLEHPNGSTLWEAAKLPGPGSGRDEFGGWTLGISQHWWGHKAEKRTLLYVCGLSPSNLPAMALSLDRATHVIAQDKRQHGCGPGRNARVTAGMPGWRPEVTKAEREHTPPPLAEWLVELARRCAQPVAVTA